MRRRFPIAAVIVATVAGGLAPAPSAVAADSTPVEITTAAGFQAALNVSGDYYVSAYIDTDQTFVQTVPATVRFTMTNTILSAHGLVLAPGAHVTLESGSWVMDARGTGHAGIETSGATLVTRATEVYAAGDTGAAGIGGAPGGDVGTVDLGGDTVIATAGLGGAGIGSGRGASETGRIRIAAAHVQATAYRATDADGTEPAGQVAGGAGIGGGYGAPGADVVLGSSNGDLTARGAAGAAGIGGGGNGGDAGSLTVSDPNATPGIGAFAGYPDRSGPESPAADGIGSGQGSASWGAISLSAGALAVDSLRVEPGTTFRIPPGLEFRGTVIGAAAVQNDGAWRGCPDDPSLPIYGNNFVLDLDVGGGSIAAPTLHDCARTPGDGDAYPTVRPWADHVFAGWYLSPMPATDELGFSFNDLVLPERFGPSEDGRPVHVDVFGVWRHKWHTTTTVGIVPPSPQQGRQRTVSIDVEAIPQPAVPADHVLGLTFQASGGYEVVVDGQHLGGGGIDRPQTQDFGPFSSGHHVAKVFFTSNEEFYPSSGSVSFDVPLLTTRTHVSAASFRAGTRPTVTVWLSRTPEGVQPQGEVAIWVNGVKAMTTVVGASGHRSVTLPRVYSGSINVSSHFLGSKSVSPADSRSHVVRAY